MKAKTMALGMCLALCSTQYVLATPVEGQGTWETTLQVRDLDGDTVADAYYDQSSGLTWLANARGLGPTDWVGAMQWVQGLEVFGVVGWRLPTMQDTGAPGCQLSASGTDCGWNVDQRSELAYMFHTTLGNLSFYDTNFDPRSPSYTFNTGPFRQLESSRYWTGVEYGPDASSAWTFDQRDGLQNYGGKSSTVIYAWAVRDGDVFELAEPVSLWLMGLGLTSLIGITRRKTRPGGPSSQEQQPIAVRTGSQAQDQTGRDAVPPSQKAPNKPIESPKWGIAISPS